MRNTLTLTMFDRRLLLVLALILFLGKRCDEFGTYPK
jgi:hypothetical protein